MIDHYYKITYEPFRLKLLTNTKHKAIQVTK